MSDASAELFTVHGQRVWKVLDVFRHIWETYKAIICLDPPTHMWPQMEHIEKVTGDQEI